MSMRMLTKYRRDLAASRVVRNGTKLQTLHANRARLTQPDAAWDHEEHFLDIEIDRLQRCVQRDLNFIRTTA